MKDIESRITAIEERNGRVELDKRWETSRTRKISIAVLTYVVVTSSLIIIGNDKPFVNSLIPVIGFLLSTSALGFIRRVWQHQRDQ